MARPSDDPGDEVGRGHRRPSNPTGTGALTLLSPEKEETGPRGEKEKRTGGGGWVVGEKERFFPLSTIGNDTPLGGEKEGRRDQLSLPG